MMTNVDFESFNDWSNTELAEAKNVIDFILNCRKREVSNALNRIETAMIELSNATEEVQYINFENAPYSLSDIFENIKLYYKERIM